MTSNHLIRNILIGLFVLFSTACGSLAGMDLAELDDDDVTQETADMSRLTDMEDELLGLINDEREALGLPRLERDPGLDAIMLFYGTDMVLYHHIGHEDINGRFPTDRVNYYSDRDDMRCSEITAWFGGSSAESHYNGYKNSPGHHSAYMEEGLFNLGPTMHVGVVVLAGTGPAGSAFEGNAGTYSGLVFCDDAVEVVIDPF